MRIRQGFTLMVFIVVLLSSLVFATNVWFTPDINSTETVLDSASIRKMAELNPQIVYTNESLQCVPGTVGDEGSDLYYQWYVNNKTVVSQRSSTEDEDYNHNYFIFDNTDYNNKGDAI